MLPNLDTFTSEQQQPYQSYLKQFTETAGIHILSTRCRKERHISDSGVYHWQLSPSSLNLECPIRKVLKDEQHWQCNDWHGTYLHRDTCTTEICYRFVNQEFNMWHLGSCQRAGSRMWGLCLSGLDPAYYIRITIWSVVTHCRHQRHCRHAKIWNMPRIFGVGLTDCDEYLVQIVQYSICNFICPISVDPQNAFRFCSDHPGRKALLLSKLLSIASMN